ncbi:hypothetical protein [Dehalobacter sp. TBBPA1]|uniref:hypothetical protein n=1 Tax=Dehalobacter sp. TBBPA1 TaxID=3235037 RepID=UPI0034A3D031
MDEKRTAKLKRIYELENLQIHYYQSQLSESDDPIFDKALFKIVEADKMHAEFFTELFREHNIDIPLIKASIADIAGSIIGEAIELAGQENICKIGFALENQILEIYADLVEENLNSDLLDKLIDFKIDKEFHALWLQHYAQYLKHQKSQKSYSNNLIQDSVEDHPTVNMNVRLI